MGPCMKQSVIVDLSRSVHVTCVPSTPWRKQSVCMCRPISKRKTFTVTSIIHKAKVFDPAVAEARAKDVIAQKNEEAKQRVGQTFGIHRGFAATGAL